MTKKYYIRKLSNVPFTKKGFDNLKKEYQEILDSKRGAIETLSRARELGDLSENGFYKSAKARLFSIYSNLRRLESLIKRAIVIEKTTEGVVGISSTVNVSDGKNQREFTLVGKYESDPLSGKISNESPIGRALMGRKIGESVKVYTPKGEVTYKILNV